MDLDELFTFRTGDHVKYTHSRKAASELVEYITALAKHPILMLPYARRIQGVDPLLADKVRRWANAVRRETRQAMRHWHSNPAASNSPPGSSQSAP